MARKISGKTLVNGELSAQTPLAVGGAGAGGDVDLELARDGRGRFYVPGTSLAGPVRHWMETHLADGPSLTKALLGFQDGSHGHASYLVISDAPVCLPDGLSSEIRSGVRIDRRTGAAEDRYLYTRAVLPRGTRIPFRLELDLPRDSVERRYGASDFEKAVALLLEALLEYGLGLGAGKTRGLGHVRLARESLRIDRHRFLGEGASTGLFPWLSNAAACVELADLGEESSVRRRADEFDQLEFSLAWRPLSPVMVKSGFDGVRADMLPLVGGVGDRTVAPVIPGSSIKGVLRSHAARILRTLLGDDSPPCGGPRGPDGELPLLDDLFGSPDRMGRVWIPDIYQVGNRIDVDAWCTEEETAMDASTVWEDHVAIDRFTGGAAENRLYNARTPVREGHWEPIRIRLDMSRPAGKSTADAELALLLFVLRDFQAGLLPVGFGTRRGKGEVCVTSTSVTGRWRGQEFTGGDEEQVVTHFSGELLAALDRSWKEAGDRRSGVRRPEEVADGSTG